MTERIARWFRRLRRRLARTPALEHHTRTLPPFKGPHDSVTD